MAKEALNIIKESHTARFECKTRQYLKVKCEAVRRGKEVREIIVICGLLTLALHTKESGHYDPSNQAPLLDNQTLGDPEISESMIDALWSVKVFIGKPQSLSIISVSEIVYIFDSNFFIS